MRIFFDHQTFSLQSFGGISRYYAELITGINGVPDNHAYLSLLFSNNVHLQEKGIAPCKLFSNVNFYRKERIAYRLNKAYNIAQLNQRKYDIFHPTYYDPYFIPHIKDHPFVITFLDMIQEKFANQFPGLDDGGITTNHQRILANRADKIIAISESTKLDIIELLNVNPDKIEVIYLGNSIKRIPSKLEDKKTIPYLLFVGRRERYKNFEGLLKAIHFLLSKHRIKLVCAGGGAFTEEENKLVHSLGVEDLVEQHPINDLILQDLYRRAIVFIFPTFYEGFGIPVLEAFACDCPCIISNSSSLPEVGGNAALYIDPNSAESIVTAVEKIIDSSALRESLILRGREQLKHFSWNNTVSETLKVYKSLT